MTRPDRAARARTGGPGRDRPASFEIDRADHQAELDRLTGLGLHVTTATHAWCHWRSIYVADPEQNIVELVCYDPSVE
jgi:hypothetical protein